MVQDHFKPLSETLQSFIERIQVSDDPTHQPPVCPVGNPKCDGYGHVTEEDGMRFCECVQIAVRNANIAHAEIPKRFLNQTLENFKPINSSAKAALTIAQEYIETFDPNNGKGLYIYGPTGSGKTHLAIGVLQTLIGRGLHGVFFNVNELFDRIRRTMDPKAPPGLAETLIERINSPVVVLDSLGGIQKTSAWVTERLYAMINAAYEDCRTILITTTLAPKELDQQFDSAIVSRILGMCREIELKGKDYRRTVDAQQHYTQRDKKKLKPMPGESVTEGFGFGKPPARSS